MADFLAQPPPLGVGPATLPLWQVSSAEGGERPLRMPLAIGLAATVHALGINQVEVQTIRHVEVVCEHENFSTEQLDCRVGLTADAHWICIQYTTPQHGGLDGRG